MNIEPDMTYMQCAIGIFVYVIILLFTTVIGLMMLYTMWGTLKLFVSVQRDEKGIIHSITNKTLRNKVKRFIIIRNKNENEKRHKSIPVFSTVVTLVACITVCILFAVFNSESLYIALAISYIVVAIKIMHAELCYYLFINKYVNSIDKLSWSQTNSLYYVLAYCFLHSHVMQPSRSKLVRINKVEDWGFEAEFSRNGEKEVLEFECIDNMFQLI